ncbi:FAD binding domain-containing protein [Collybia nuda]|uniref:FAD binding domain-containing protein n=1 Tax=Collybia nuda TaxID=64659 RepID=A0A9P5YGN3_9AGAR|nr:FAD binding domain-containing protein [Collybia nuda]
MTDMLQISIPDSIDVLVVGGGPTGLLISLILLRSGLKVLTIEQYDKFEQAMYGRACVLYSGSMELLDLNGIYDRIADIGFIVRDAITFKDGEPSENRGWSFIDKAIVGQTHFDFSFTIRQKYIEDAIRVAISEIDPNAVRGRVKLINYQEAKSAQHSIIATLEHEGRITEVKRKYLVGADGGRSTVRSIGEFPFPGTSSPYKWVRLDAIVKTDMPSSRSKAVALESREHGNVLWTPTDNGRTRIGFVCPADVYGKDGSSITEEAIIDAARNAVKPFSLEFEKLDWWTVYSISQRVAEKYQKGHVILAGDAAHTHSSGSAQGMNTGIHDATNLAWKLAGVVNGLYGECVLETYDLERRKSAQRLIQLDRDISALISGTIPSHFNAPPGANCNEYLEIVYSSNASFTVGLGVSYETNLLNQATSIPDQDGVPSVKVGHRAPDAPVFRPGAAFPKPLRSLLSYVGRFWILIFAGTLEPASESVYLNPACSAKYRNLREYFDAPCSFTNTHTRVSEFITILRGEGCLQVSEALGVEPLGKTVYDRSGETFAKYGVDETTGAMVVVRPDGIVSFTSRLDGTNDLSKYFTSFTLPTKKSVVQHPTAVDISGGEISIEGQEESTVLRS